MEDGRPTGLVNLGNTCFMNACLQILNQTPELFTIVTKGNTKAAAHPDPSNVSDTSLAREWHALYKLMHQNHHAISPNKFVQHVQQLAQIKRRPLFTGWAQNDMAEFLLFLVEAIHHSMSRKVHVRIHAVTHQTIVDKLAVKCFTMLKEVYEKEYSEVLDLFYGISVSELVSLDSKQVLNTKPEHFFLLDLPVPPPTESSTTLTACFDAFVAPELLTGDNAWFNEATGTKVDVQKRTTFWNFPTIVAIALKRFDHGHGTVKLNTRVAFPVTGLDLSKYVSGYTPHRYMYDLYGISLHEGSVHGGHYTSCVLTDKKTWVHFNDAHGQVMQDPDWSAWEQQAYCLFYRMRT